ncbi:MAG: TonB-dependent receptor [Flavobacteriia bacterium]|nr:TonB-dependent receptor [Flavobacteriia bacterium]
MKVIFFLIFTRMCICGYAQDIKCSLTIKGQILDQKSKEGIPYSKIKFQNTFFLSDSIGKFEFTKLCSGKYSIDFFHSENESPTIIQLELSSDTSLIVEIESCFHELQDVVIEGHIIKNQEIESLQKITLTNEDLDKIRGKSLGESLKAISGVNSVQTGPTISKPMIHGLYGNRVLILNNGVRLEGQNWGSDHAPEIDPFIASKLSVIKGASSIRYGLEAIAGVVLVETKELPRIRALRGEMNSICASNGKSGTISNYLEGCFDKKLKGLSWRAQVTGIERGSMKTPTYYLTNSASIEKDFSVVLNYITTRFKLNTYYSSFNSKNGIYTGSNVEKLDDLLLLYQSKTPLVPSIFSYKINRGFQEVNHQMLKVKSEYQFQKYGKVIYTFSIQKNKRSEFEGGGTENETTNNPDALFQLNSQISELVWEHQTYKHFSGCIGLNLLTQQNTFSGSEEVALIPNYLNLTKGIFWMEKYHFRKIIFEAGLRYDSKQMLRIIENPDKIYQKLTWNNTSFSLGSIYQFSKKINLHLAFSKGWRPPSPIEMYANGIHQSAASFEIGDSTLQSEISNNLQLFLNYSKEKLNFEIGAYTNQMNHFIYINPTKQFIETEFGVFPLFKYQQANVIISGIDFAINYKFLPFITLQSKSSLIYAYNQSIHDFLINIPSNRTDLSLQFDKEKWGKLEKIYFQIGVLYVAKQWNLPQDVDFIDSPKAYLISNIETGFSINIKEQELKLNLSINNLTNESYRDYLNRFRYYSNELGRNISIRLKIPFKIY